MSLTLQLSTAITWLVLSQMWEAAAEPASAGRIIGGQDVDITEAKFAVQLLIQAKVCAGSLVTPRHVVTAAHCVRRAKPSEVEVTAGATYFHKEGTRQAVRKIYLHPAFDVAVLKLSGPLEGSNIETIELCNVQLQEGDLVSVYGWGQTVVAGGKSFNEPARDRNMPEVHQCHLQKVELPLQGQDTCSKHFPTKNISQGYFCAGIAGEKYSTDGDYGGPAVFNNRLCGVVACGGPSPDLGLYVNVNLVKKFLYEKMSKL